MNKGDARYWKIVDDPEGNEDDPPDRIVAIPMLVKLLGKQQAFSFPRGVVVAINRVEGGDFGVTDIEVVKAYNCLAARIIDISG